MRVTVNDMSDEATKVTIRMGPDVIQAMEDFMADHGIENRSDFIRDAISDYIASQENGGSASTGGIFVRFSELQMDALENIIQSGVAYDVEELVRGCVLHRTVPEQVQTDPYANASRSAQRNAVLK